MVDRYGKCEIRGDIRPWTAGTVVNMLSVERGYLIFLVLGQSGFAIWSQTRSAQRRFRYLDRIKALGAKMTKNGKLVEEKLPREVMRTGSEYPKAYFTRP